MGVEDEFLAGFNSDRAGANQALVLSLASVDAELVGRIQAVSGLCPSVGWISAAHPPNRI